MTDFDGVVRALADGSRRRILTALREEKHVDPFPGDGDEPDRALRLHHVHLPLMEEAGLVEWDRDTGVVRRGDEFETVEPVLTALDARGDALPDDYSPEEGRTC